MTVLDAVQTCDSDALERWVTIKKNHAQLLLQLDGHAAASHLASSDDLKPWLWNYALAASTGDERQARLATGWLQDQINSSMSDRSDGESAITARILFNDERGAFSTHVVPCSLLAAMWLQCARVVTMHPVFKACQHCGSWFELSPDARRRQTKFCSDRCRVAAYRERRSARLAPAAS